MADIEGIIEKSHRARLFPVLAETSKEGRAVSILLSCLANVSEFGKAMLGSIGQRVGTRAQIEAYTEVAFPQNKGDRGPRPDGLIVIRVGQRRWSALVEAKVGANELRAEQIETYCDIARRHGVDAVITVSNEFTALPSHHPVPLPAAARKKLELYHWSWMYVLTTAKLLIDTDDVADTDQAFILSEFVRFMSHASAGVKGFDQMPAPWPDLVAKVQAGGRPGANDEATREVVGAWHQEVRDLSLILSRQLTCEVEAHLPRAQKNDLETRVKADIARLCEEGHLSTTLVVPDAASPLDVRADLRSRTLAVAMKLRAPEDRKSNKARLTWLLKQLEPTEPEGVHVRLHFLGRAPMKQASLAEARENADALAGGSDAAALVSFEVLLVRDLGTRFAQRKTFIVELEKAVPDFYTRVGQRLKAWQARAPRLTGERAEPDSVSVAAMAREEERPDDGLMGVGVPTST